MKGLTPVEARMLDVVVSDIETSFTCHAEQDAVMSLVKRGLIVIGDETEDQLLNVRATPMGIMMHAISKVTT